MMMTTMMMCERNLHKTKGCRIVTVTEWKQTERRETAVRKPGRKWCRVCYVLLISCHTAVQLRHPPYLDAVQTLPVSPRDRDPLWIITWCLQKDGARELERQTPRTKQVWHMIIFCWWNAVIWFLVTFQAKECLLHLWSESITDHIARQPHWQHPLFVCDPVSRQRALSSL